MIFLLLLLRNVVAFVPVQNVDSFPLLNFKI